MIKLVVGRNLEQLNDAKELLVDTEAIEDRDSVEQLSFPEQNLHPSKHYEIVDQIVYQYKQYATPVILLTHSNTIHVYASTLIRLGVLTPDDVCIVLVNDNNDNTRQYYFRTDGLMNMDWFGKGFWTTTYKPNDIRVCSF